MTAKFENPLLGVYEDKTESLYEQFEALVLDRSGKTSWKLFEFVPPFQPNRWPFLAIQDNLTHALMPAYATRFWGTTYSVCPTYGITECGIHATLKVQDEKLGVYVNGVIAPGMLTCLACLSGVATEGQAMRQLQKQLNFANAYGMSAERISALNNTNKPNMQQVPRFAGTRTGRMSSSQPNMSAKPRYSLKAVAQQFIRQPGKKPP